MIELPTGLADPRRLIYRRPDLLADRSTHYCPGCGHGIIHRLVAELIAAMELMSCSPIPTKISLP